MGDVGWGELSNDYILYYAILYYAIVYKTTL